MRRCRQPAAVFCRRVWRGPSAGAGGGGDGQPNAGWWPPPKRRGGAVTWSRPHSPNHVSSRTLLRADRADEAGNRARSLLRRPRVAGPFDRGCAVRGRTDRAGTVRRGPGLGMQYHRGGSVARGSGPGAVIGRRRNWISGRAVDRTDVAIATATNPEVSGWRAVRAWSCRDLAQLAAIAVRLGRCGGQQHVPSLLARAGAGAAGARCALRRSRPASSGTRRNWSVGTETLPPRRRRLAAVVAAGALLSRQDGPEVRALLGAARGPGPEGTASVRLAASLRHANDADPALSSYLRRPAVPGIELFASGRRDMHLVDGLSGLMSLIEEADDELGVLVGACKWICRQAGALRVAIVSADGATMVAAEGWRRPDLSGEIAEILRGPARDVRLPDHDVTTGAFGASVRYGGVITGPRRGVTAVLSDRSALRQAAQAVAALCGSALRARLDALTAGQRARQSIPEFVGDSPLMAVVREAVVRAASAPFPVLIEGESGTGKELVARALHRLGPRRDHRLSAVNCAALTDDLVEAELFGHTRGAFTGAVGPRAGLFEDAHGGTLFLDEVTELSPRAQAKLLRVLQERECGASARTSLDLFDVRVVAACNVPYDRGGSSREVPGTICASAWPSSGFDCRHSGSGPKMCRRWRRRSGDGRRARPARGGDTRSRCGRAAHAACVAQGTSASCRTSMAGLVVGPQALGRVTARHVDQVLSQVAVAGEMPGVRLGIARRTFERRVITAALVRHAGRRGAAAVELGLSRQGLTKALRRLGLATDEDAAGVA